jgi:hypothetical protein
MGKAVQITPISKTTRFDKSQPDWSLSVSVKAKARQRMTVIPIASAGTWPLKSWRLLAG